MISRTCIKCKKPVEIPITEDEVKAWQESGDHIQHVFPQLNEGQREILISGICDPCFDAMFADDEDDDGGECEEYERPEDRCPPRE